MTYEINCLGDTKIVVNSLEDLSCSDRQRLADKLCERYPFTNQNTVVEYILSKGYEDPDAPFCYDNIDNNIPTGSVKINGDWLELFEHERDEKLSHYEYLLDKATDIYSRLEEKLDALSDCDLEDDKAMNEYAEVEDRMNSFESDFVDHYVDTINELESMDFDDYPEIFQWFEVDNYIIRKLDEHGEAVLDGCYWGRQCYGQSITLDHVIQKIAFEVLAWKI